MTIENKSYTVTLTKNPSISMNVIPGHYTTNSFHVTHYLDLEDLKINALKARDVARELAIPYLSSTLVDTIVCLEGTEVIGAYIAEELLQEGTAVINSGLEIHVVTPRLNTERKMMLLSNTEESIRNKNIIILVGTVSTGVILDKALEFIEYYGGKVVGISSLFSVYPNKYDQEINSMFTNDDIPGYQLFSQKNCLMCNQGKKLEAIIVDGSYKEI